jgi:hypothetical protein
MRALISRQGFKTFPHPLRSSSTTEQSLTTAPSPIEIGGQPTSRRSESARRYQVLLYSPIAEARPTSRFHGRHTFTRTQIRLGNGRREPEIGRTAPTLALDCQLLSDRPPCTPLGAAFWGSYAATTVLHIPVLMFADVIERLLNSYDTWVGRGST